MAPYPIHVNLCQKHLFLYEPTIWRQIVHWITSSIHENSKLSTSCVHKLFSMSKQKLKKQSLYTTCSEHGIFMHWTLQFKGQSFVIFRVSWCKNKCFWKKLTFTSLASQNRIGGRHELAPVLSSRDLVKTVRVDTRTWKKKSKFNQNLQVQALADPIRFTKGVCF